MLSKIKMLFGKKKKEEKEEQQEDQSIKDTRAKVSETLERLRALNNSECES